MLKLNLLYQYPKFVVSLMSFNNFLPIVVKPTLNIVKFKAAFADNFQDLSGLHFGKFAFSQSYRHWAHFAFYIDFFDTQNMFPLERNYFVAVSCPID